MCCFKSEELYWKFGKRETDDDGVGCRGSEERGNRNINRGLY